MEIKYHFYDLTFEDFKDKGLLKELSEKQIIENDDINSIINITKSFEAKK